MVFSKALLIGFTGVSLCLANISGIVTDTGATPIAGAVVQLEKVGLTTTTGTDGRFTLVTGTAVLPGKGSLVPKGLTARIINTMMTVTVAEPSVVEVATFELTGKALSTVRLSMTTGCHTLMLKQRQAGVYLYKVKSGNGELLLKGNSVGGVSTGSAVTPQDPTTHCPAKLAKSTTAYNDAVLITKAGYLSYRMKITTGDTSGMAIVMTVGTGLELVGLQRMIVLKNIAAGTFSIGDTSVGVTPVHQVTLSAFAMQETDVTEEQYSAVTGKNLSTFQTGDSAILCPVDSIRWYDAVLFCNALSKMSDLDTCYNYSQSGATDAVCNFTKNGYRLPTEAQWEYACRAGSTTLYWWGSDTNGMGARVWWYKNSNNRIHPVAKKVANAWGLYDMMGDVWQWCNDWYGAYTAGPVTDPTGAASGTNRIFRGGSWSDDGLGFYISASRNGAVPSYCDNHHGFRVVLPR